MEFLRVYENKITTNKKKDKSGDIAIFFPKDVSSFSLQKSIELSKEVKNAKQWSIIASRSGETTITFFLEDKHGEVREIEWMKFHSAVLYENWREFDNLVKNVRADLDSIERKKDKLLLYSLEKFNELKKVSDSELVSRDKEVVELLKEVGP